MEVSSTSINVASITAIAISHGFLPPGAEPPLAGCGVISFCPRLSGRMDHFQMRPRASGFQGCWLTVVWDDLKTILRRLNYHGWRRDSMIEQLADKKCVPCRGGVPPLKGKELGALRKVVPQWNIIEEHHLDREYKFPDFAKALEFVNRVGALAEEQGHHPDILLAWGKAEVTLWTHKVNGLTESDFIMAAKIDRIAGK